MASLSLSTFMEMDGVGGKVKHDVENSRIHYAEMQEFEKRAKYYEEMAELSLKCYESFEKMAYARAYRALRSDPVLAYDYAHAQGGNDL